MEHRRALRADCARCSGLCCAALAFDASTQFAYDKPADEPCRHLLEQGRCAVHGSRERRGFAGCTSYDCYGAGQRVSSELFAGRSWRAEPALAPAMFEAFRRWKHVHELRWLLREAERLGLDEERERQRLALLALLEGLVEPGLERLEPEVRGFLRGLREIAAGVPARRRLPLSTSPR